jgi:hypothetical protein
MTRNWRRRLVDSCHLGQSRLLGAFQVILTLNLVMIGWVFFRAKSADAALYIVRHMYFPSRVSMADVTYGVGLQQFQAGLAGFFILVLFLVDFFIEYRPKVIFELWERRALRWGAYVGAAYSLVFFGVWERIEFIYFQF